MEVRTKADDVFDAIKKKGVVKFGDLIKEFGVPSEILDFWIDIWKKMGLIHVIYPSSPFGDIKIYSREAWIKRGRKGEGEESAH